MAALRWTIALIFLFALVIFGSENMAPVEINYYFGQVTMPMFLLMALLVLVGASFSALVGILEQMKLKARIRSQAKKIKTLEAEMSALGRKVEADQIPGGEGAGA